MTEETQPFEPGDRLKWSGKSATVTRLHGTAPQMFIRMDQGFFGQEVLIGFDNEGIDHALFNVGHTCQSNTSRVKDHAVMIRSPQASSPSIREDRHG